MLKNLLILITLISPLSSGIYSNDFCKKKTTHRCTQRNAPYIHECGQSVCTRNQTECKEYLRVENLMKQIHFIELIEPMSLKRRPAIEKEFERKFKKFQIQIEKCPLKPFDWQPSDVCNVQRRECFQSRKEILAKRRQTNCPCPRSRPFVCGNQRNHCTKNKKTCASFRFTYRDKHSLDRFQLLAIKK